MNIHSSVLPVASTSHVPKSLSHCEKSHGDSSASSMPGRQSRQVPRVHRRTVSRLRGLLLLLSWAPLPPPSAHSYLVGVARRISLTTITTKTDYFYNRVPTLATTFVPGWSTSSSFAPSSILLFLTAKQGLRLRHRQTVRYFLGGLSPNR